MAALAGAFVKGVWNAFPVVLGASSAEGHKAFGEDASRSFSSRCSFKPVDDRMRGWLARDHAES